MATTSTVSGRLMTDQGLISSYNRGPITSVWALPASCTETLSFTDASVSGGLYFGHSGTIFDNRCFPTANSVPASVGDDWGVYYYSPAICPSGWIAAPTFSSSWPVYPYPDHVYLGPGTTAALCCPSGYVLYQDGHQCSSTISAGQRVSLYSYSLNRGSWERGTPITYSFLTATAVKGDGIPIWWQSSDAAILASASANTPTPTSSLPSSTPTSQSTIGTAETSAIPPPSSMPTNTDVPQPGGLSTGAKIGLGVGIPFAVIAVLVIAFVLWKKRQRHQTAQSGAVYEAGDTEYKNVAVAPADNVEQYHEIHTSPEAYHNRHELPAALHR